MSEIKRLLNKIPGYAIKYLVIIAITQIIAYVLPLWFVPAENAHVLSSKIDEALPVVCGFVYAYVGAYVLWVWGYCYNVCASESLARRYTIADVMCKAVGFACFVFYPCTLAQPAIDELTGFGAWCLKLIYMIDRPVNLLPSFHCYMTHMVVRPMLAGWHKQIKKPVRIALYIFAVLIYISTLLVKQHVLADVITGIALAEIMWQIAGLITRRMK